MLYTRIKDLREDHDIKQIDVAHYLNIKQSTYSKYELGKINIPIEMMSRIADLYNTSVDYLMSRTNTIEPYPKP